MKTISDRRVTGGSNRQSLAVLPCDIYPEFIQTVIQDVSLVLFMAAPLSGRFLVLSFYRWTVAVASYVRN